VLAILARGTAALVHVGHFAVFKKKCVFTRECAFLISGKRAFDIFREQGAALRR
jgi:hypothetical protein